MVRSRSRLETVVMISLLGALALVGVLLLAVRPTPPALVVTASALIIALGLWSWRATKDLFHPLVFPLLYLLLALLGSWCWIAVTGQDLWRIPATALRSTATTLLTLTVVGWAVGSLVGVLVPSRSKRRHQQTPDASGAMQADSHTNVILHRLGRALLCGLVLAKLLQIYLTSGTAYGEDQVSYSLNSALTTAAEGLLIVAVLLIVSSGVRGILGSGLTVVDAILFLAIFALGVAFLGSRGEFLAPLLLLAWSVTRTWRVPPFVVVGAAAGVAALYSVVGVVRSRSGVQQFGLVERFFVDTASPYVISYELARLVPSESPYLWGATYLESLRMALPGPISRMLSDGDLHTASFRFRDLLGIDDPNYGLGFAFPAETYWNFGLIGALLLACAVGALFARSYYWTTEGGVTRATQAVYPVLIAALPYAMRSDSLAQLKTTVYPLILLWLALRLANYLARKSKARA